MSAIRIDLPEPVRQRAEELAHQQSMSLDRLVVLALVEKLANVFPDANLEARAERGKRAGFDRFMNGVPDIEPDDFDQLPPSPKSGK
jgi:hypothetical protein